MVFKTPNPHLQRSKPQIKILTVKTSIWLKIVPNQRKLAENCPHILNKNLVYMTHLAQMHISL